MQQTRLGSLIESFANVFVGFGVSFAANLVVLPIFGYSPTVGAALAIGAIMTVISIARSYILRRGFERLRGII